MVRQDQRAAGTEVRIGAIESCRVVRGEVIGRRERAVRDRKLHDAVAIIHAGRRLRRGSALRNHVACHRKVAIARRNENSSAIQSIRGKSVPRRPESAAFAVRRRAELSCERERRCVVAQHPTVPIAVIAKRREADVHESIQQQQSGALVFVNAVERHHAARAAVARARRGCRDLHRPAKFFRAGGDVQRVQTVNANAVLVGQHDHVQRVVVGSITGVPVMPFSG